MIKAVIFDMDGVLIDSEPENLAIIRNFYEAHDKVASDAYLLSLVGRSQHDTWDLTLAAWGEDIAFDTYCDKFKAFRDVYPIDYQKILFPGVIETLTWLKQEGYKIAVASSSKMRTINHVLQTCNLESFFDLKMSGEMFTYSKPNPEIYLESAKQLGFDIDQCIAVEDSSAGIAACKNANMKVIAKIDPRYGADPMIANYQIHDIPDLQAILRSLR